VAPAGSNLKRGDLVVGIVRRPDPVPCAACAAGEWDMCRNGQYTERGIKQRNGYGSEQYRVEPEFLVKLDPALKTLGVLLEPASIVAKAWEQVGRIGSRAAFWQPRVALITGAGPVGLLVLVAVVDAVLGSTLGLFVSAFANTEFQAVQFMPAFVLPQFLLCGLLVPRDALPAFLEAVSNVLPLSYAVDAMRTLTTDADASAQVLADVAIVVAFALAAVALGSATLRRRTP